ncbi:alpha/beta hydrolase family protein [Alcanivorax xiamenensis]|uniref:alpha/beta hydrolase family protein n=1 Tax=Alcanivorax xiamenensis TaxID=1177156 RepID=UPI001914EF48|nr:prolyl oligopeptidase family serine peptidase [Alcanivorax xiamenensis]
MPGLSTGADPASPSPLSAHQAVAATVEFGELHSNAQRVIWTRSDPRDGRFRVQEWTTEGRRTLTPEGFSVRSRVYEYGGSALCLGEDGLAFVNEDDQQLYWQGFSEPRCHPLTDHPDRRYGGLAYDHRRDRIIAVEERPGNPKTRHRLVAVGRDRVLRILSEGADFYASPAISDDGQQLAWVEWDRPHQPWTASRLRHVSLADDGLPGTALAGLDTPGHSTQQPRFDRQGRLLCLFDGSGHWRPWRFEHGHWRCLPGREADHTPSPWLLGSRHYDTLPDGSPVVAWWRDGRGHLSVTKETVAPAAMPSGYQHFLAISAGPLGVFCLAAGPRRGTALLHLNAGEGGVSTLDSAPLPLEATTVSPRIRRPPSFAAKAASHSGFVVPFVGRGPGGAPLGSESLGASVVSEPEAWRFASAGQTTCHGFYYPPCPGDCTPPPLLVTVHGGPTSASFPLFNPAIQFWTQRGFAVLDLNYRGSVGFGRAYRQSLAGQWGVSDVDDVLYAVKALIRERLADPRRLFLRGQSAGGFTVLNTLARAPTTFRAATSLYGVSDPLRLRRQTHKFEADYIDWLIGDPERNASRYQARSPLANASRLRTPTLFFQGLRDAVVLPEQTEAMVAALHANGVPVECVRFADEQHGFRSPRNRALVLERELAFYRHHDAIGRESGQ